LGLAFLSQKICVFRLFIDTQNITIFLCEFFFKNIKNFFSDFFLFSEDIYQFVISFHFIFLFYHFLPSFLILDDKKSAKSYTKTPSDTNLFLSKKFQDFIFNRLLLLKIKVFGIIME